EFYNERRNALKQRLLNRVFLTIKIDSSPSTIDTDEGDQYETSRSDSFQGTEDAIVRGSDLRHI
ncbi:hypothetical protein EVY28_28400, partial [Klebsiella pneumoniae]